MLAHTVAAASAESSSGIPTGRSPGDHAHAACRGRAFEWRLFGLGIGRTSASTRSAANQASGSNRSSLLCGDRDTLPVEVCAQRGAYPRHSSAHSGVHRHGERELLGASSARSTDGSSKKRTSRSLRPRRVSSSCGAASTAGRCSSMLLRELELELGQAALHRSLARPADRPRAGTPAGLLHPTGEFHRRQPTPPSPPAAGGTTGRSSNSCGSVSAWSSRSGAHASFRDRASIAAGRASSNRMALSPFTRAAARHRHFSFLR